MGALGWLLNLQFSGSAFTDTSIAFQIDDEVFVTLESSQDVYVVVEYDEDVSP